MYRKNVANQSVWAQMNATADGAALTTGVTVKVAYAGNYGDGAGACTHRGGGLWEYVFDQGETNHDQFGYQFNHATGVSKGGTIIPTAANPTDAVRFGLTALPNAAADAAGGLPISDAGGLDIDTKLANTNEVTTARMGALTDLINGGRLDLLIDAIKAATDKLETAMEADSAVYRFTTNALEQAPTGGAAPSAETIRAEIDSNSTRLASIDGKTANLPSDPADESLIIAATDAIMTRLGSPRLASMSADIGDITANLSLIAPTTDASDSATVTKGTVIAGTYASTQTDDDATKYTLAPVNPGGLDMTLVFQIGLGRAPVSVTINGYWNGSGQYCNVFAYDYLLGIWDQLSNSSTRLASRTSDANYAFGLNREHIDPDTGDVSIRFVSPSTTTGNRLYLDRVLVGTIDQAQGASAGISAQDVWAFASRTLTSDTGEPIDSTALAAAVLAAMNATPPDVNTKSMTDIAFTNTQLTTLAGITAPSADDVAAKILVTPAQKVVTDASGYVTANVNGAITVTGDVQLAANQPNYAPAKAGDAMALTSGERTTLATSVWSSATRTLTSFGSLIADIWTSATRTLTAFAFSISATVTDKTGFSLTSAYDPAKTAAQATDLATVDGIVDAIKLKTDNLPSDPADESLLIAAIGTPMQAGATVAATLADKTGFKLASDGLDSVAAATDVTTDVEVRATFMGQFRGLFNRFYNKVTQSSTQQIVRNDSDNPVSTMAVADNGTVQTKDKSA